MGLSMVDSRAGAPVWVQRENGSWWPGRVVDPTELSPSRVYRRRGGTLVVKLLGRDDASIQLFNFDKSKRIKPFRCSEFVDCIKGVESNQDTYSQQSIKYVPLNNAIRHALQLEGQMRRKRKATEEEQVGIVGYAKRGRHVYMPNESNCLDFPLKYDSAENGSPLRSTKAALIESGSNGSNAVQRERKLSVADTLAATLLSQLRKCDEKTRNANCKCSPKSNDISEFSPPHIGSAKHLAREEKMKRKQNISNILDGLGPAIDLTSSSKTRNGTQYNDKPVEDSIEYSICNTTETTLIDVDVTVKAIHQRNHVPLVSLMSRLNEKAIVGYPINIEKASGIGLSGHLTGAKKCESSKTTVNSVNKLSWKTSRRTPVCYVSPPNSPLVPKDDESAKDHQNTEKKLCGNEGNVRFVTVSCVPVAKIFSKLLLSVGGI